MTRYTLVSTLTLAVAMALPVAAAPRRNVITTAQIAAAISDAGVKISAKQVMLLTEVVAKSSVPALKVQSMVPWGDHRVMVRLDCAMREQCLPFYVAVRSIQENVVPPVFNVSNGSSIEASRQKPNPELFVVRVGAPAILLLDGGHVHIQLTVVCLEDGAAGKTIRVVSKDHRQTYAAEVFSGGILRGKL